MFSKSWFPELVAYIFLQPEPREVAQLQAKIYSGPESLGAVAFCMGDVLASARFRYGSPWVSALQIPRQSSDLFVFYTPIRSGLAYSFYGFPASGDRAEGLYCGEPRLYVGKSTYGGITEGCWRAFAQDHDRSASEIFGGEFSTLETCLRLGLAAVGTGKKSPP